MDKQKKKFHVFFGWWMVVIPSILTGLASNFYSSGMSILFKPVAADLGLSRAATSLASAIGRLEGGLEAPLTGWLSDKYGPKWVMIAGLFLLLAGQVFMYFISAPWHYYIAWGVLMGLGNNLALTIAIDKALSNWFIGKRGVAFGTRFAIVGICGALIMPLIAWLADEQGWRTTCLIWTIVPVAGIPLTWYFIKQERPEHYGLLPDGIQQTSPELNKDTIYRQGQEYAESFQEREFTLKQAAKTQAYWLTCVAWSCSILVAGGFNIHIVPMLTDMNIPSTVAGGMVSIMLFATIPSRFLSGFMADRVAKNRMKYIAAGAFIIQAAGISVFLARPGMDTAYILLILYGFGNGATTPLRLSMGGRFFGRKAFASILGTTMLITTPVSMIAPIYAGWIYDTTGSYTNAFLLFAILLAAAALLVSFVRPPGAPARLPDSHLSV